MRTNTETALTPFIGKHVRIERQHGDRIATFTGTVRSSFMLDDDELGHETGFSDQGIVSIVPTDCQCGGTGWAEVEVAGELREVVCGTCRAGRSVARRADQGEFVA